MKQNKVQWATRTKIETKEDIAKLSKKHGKAKAIFIEEAVECYKQKLLKKFRWHDETIK